MDQVALIDTPERTYIGLMTDTDADALESLFPPPGAEAPHPEDRPGGVTVSDPDRESDPDGEGEPDEEEPDEDEGECVACHRPLNETVHLLMPAIVYPLPGEAPKVAPLMVMRHAISLGVSGAATILTEKDPLVDIYQRALKDSGAIERKEPARRRVS